jgi:hypothetical protein
MINADEIYQKKAEIQGKSCALDIIDVSGLVRFIKPTFHYIHSTHAHYTYLLFRLSFWHSQHFTF